MPESPPDRHGIADLLAPEISELIESSDNRRVRLALMELMDPEIADVLSVLPRDHRVLAFRLLPRARAADVFTFLPSEVQDELIDGLSREQLAQILNEMDPDDRAELFDELPGQVAARLLTLVRPDERERTQVILGYPPESVGRLMTPNYLIIRPDWTVHEVFDHIRKHGQDAETVQMLYMIDDRGRLIDQIRLRQLVLADPDQTCGNLREEGRVISLNATDDREEAVRVMERYDQPVLPVVDRDNVLMGIVTFDDVADVAAEEATEDIQKLGGMAALDEPYISASIWTMFRKRGGWLAILFFGQMFTATAMENFEGQLAAVIALAIFIPLIISSGGNSGSQATSLIIRAMAVGEVTLRDWWRVMRREAMCGLLLGVFLAVIGLVRVITWHWLGWYDYAGNHMLVALTVAVALVGVVFWGSLVGSMLPFALRRVGLDPATSSAPFVATFVDVTGLLIYFYTAILIMNMIANGDPVM